MLEYRHQEPEYIKNTLYCCYSHEIWINYRTIAETLKKEKYFYEGQIDAYANTPDKEKLFIERVESLISREHSLWVTAHAEKEEEKEKKAKRTSYFSERRY